MSPAGQPEEAKPPIDKVKRDDEKAPEQFKSKEFEKVKADKEHPEKVKADKEQPEKLKPEKEHQKGEFKEIEKIKSDKEFEKFKSDKELVREKQFPDKLDKEIAEGRPGEEVVDPAVALDPAALLAHADNLEQAGRQLRHFIERSMRPDLSTGALQNEADLAGEPGQEEGDG